MAKNVDSQIFVGDVYDLAADIGKEFEKLIDLCGTDSIKELMTKVIVTLEYLESSTIFVDGLQSELSDVKTRVEQLEYEKLERAEFRNKLDQELEIIEENWRKETSHLNTLVAKLQEENKRLNAIITEKEAPTNNDYKTILSDEELVVVQKLKELAEQHRGQLISKDKELLEKSNELEKVQIDLDKLTKVYKELSRRNQYLQKQLYNLVAEKSDLQIHIKNQEKQHSELEAKLSVAVKENIDLSTAEDKSKQDLQGKLVIHLDDPNRPRFTLDELRHILFERNDLKSKICDLQDELSILKQSQQSPSHSSPAKKPVSIDQNELPVQGPINKEPDEKLYPEKKRLGIRRFFHFLRRFSVDSAQPLVQFSASPLLPGQS